MKLTPFSNRENSDIKLAGLTLTWACECTNSTAAAAAAAMEDLSPTSSLIAFSLGSHSLAVVHPNCDSSGSHSPLSHGGHIVPGDQKSFVLAR